MRWLRNWGVISDYDNNRLFWLSWLFWLSVGLTWLRSVGDNDVTGDLWCLGRLFRLYDSAVIDNQDWLSWLSCLGVLDGLHDSAVVDNVDRLSWLGVL